MNYGRYQIVSELGRGSMGVVFKAHDPQIDRPIALKVLREDRVTSDDFVRRFFKEAMAVGRLSHPGIVTVYDVGQDQGTIYIAMEFLQGTPLDELMTAKRFDLPDIVDIGLQAAQALHYAHQHGIVHRDIKPPNIIYSPEGTVRLTDFGIAHIEDPGGHHMTQAGEILGTPLYMSPEQVTGQPLDGRSDLYSLGVILYRMTTSRLPFEGSTLAAIFHAITQDTPDEPCRLDQAVPERLSRTIMKLLAKDPAQRFPTGNDLIDALKGALQTPPPKKTSSPRPTKVTKNSRSLSPVTILLLCFTALIVCVGLVGSYYYFQQPPVQSTPKAPAAQQTVVPTSGVSEGEPTVSKEKPPAEKTEEQVSERRQQQTENASKQPAVTPKMLLEKPEPKTPPEKIITEKQPQTIENVPPDSLQAHLKMDSRPTGANLYIDGMLVGKTPFTKTISAQKHEVRLQLDNYLGWEAQLDLSKGGEIPLSIRLLPKRTTKP